VQGRRQFRLDRDDADTAGIPGCNAADQPAAAYRDEERVDLRCIVFYLAPDRALADHGFGLVVCMSGERAGAGDKILAGRQRIRVAVAGDDKSAP
jgi:hypothetical protein